MRAATLIALVGVPAYAVFMVLATPASFIASRARHAADGQASFSDARGTLWSGSMRAEVGPVDFDRIAWRLVPARLMEGRIAFDLEVDSRAARGSAQLLRGWSEWEVRGGAARIEAASLPALVPMVAAWRPEGSVNVTADGIRWNDREVHGPLALEWRDAAVALSDVKPLGTYRLAAQGVGDTLKLALTTVAGALVMKGEGEAKLPRGGSFAGEARAEGPSAAALEPLLGLMGPKRPDGARAIEVRIR